MTRACSVTSGIRVGVPAITTRGGMNEGHMEPVVSMIDKVLMDTDNEATITNVKNDGMFS